MAKFWDDNDASVEMEFDKYQTKGNALESQIKGKSEFGPSLEHTVGICASCGNYAYARNDMHQVVVSRCAFFEVNICKSRIEECSGYRKRGEMTLSQMYELAILINPTESSKIVDGFVGCKPKQLGFLKEEEPTN